MANNRIVITPEVRMSFPHVIEAKEYMEKGKPSGKFSFSSEILIPEDSLGRFKIVRGDQLVDVDLNSVLVELAKEKWPGIIIKEAFAGVAQKGWPLKRGDAVADIIKAKGKQGEHYRGHRLMAVKSNVSANVQPPVLQIAAKGGAKTLSRMIQADMSTAKMAFTGGNYAIFELNLLAQEVGGMKYITPYFNLARFTREGEKLGGNGGSLMSRFDGVNGGQSDHNPLEGADDEIPF